MLWYKKSLTLLNLAQNIGRYEMAFTYALNPYTDSAGTRVPRNEFFISTIGFDPNLEYPTTIEPVDTTSSPGYLNLLEVTTDSDVEAGQLASEPFLLSFDGLDVERYKIFILRKRFQLLTRPNPGGILRVWFLLKARGLRLGVDELEYEKSRPILSGNLVLTIETEEELIKAEIVRFPLP